MKDIYQKFASKVNIDINSINFLYEGIQIKEDLTFEKLFNIYNRNQNKMVVIVNLKNQEDKTLTTSKMKYKNIICPKCGDISKIKLEDYRISLYECKNKHVINNILINEFEKMQYNDLICNECKKTNKNNFEFYICNTCNLFLCPICKKGHNKKHNIINYAQINYICKIHNKQNNLYCKSCEKDICIECEKDHTIHKIINYNEILSNINEIKLKDLRNGINNLKNNINFIF